MRAGSAASRVWGMNAATHTTTTRTAGAARSTRSTRDQAILVAVEDPVLHPEAMHVAAATGRAIVDTTDPVDIHRHLNKVSAVLIDAPTAAGITNDRRWDRIFLLGSDPGPPDYHTALAIRAEQALLLPAQTAELLQALGREDESAPPGRHHATVTGVLGVAGGVGVSTIAAALARIRSATHRTVLVDAVPTSGGIDLLVGAEEITGARWPDLGFTRGAVKAEDVLAALPVMDETMFILSGARSPVGDTFDLGPDEVTAALTCLTAADGELEVVVDLNPGEITREVIPLLDHLILVVPAEVRAVAAAAERLRHLRAFPVPVSVVLRHRGWSGLDVIEVERILGTPVIAELGTITRLPRAVEMHGLTGTLPRPLVTVGNAIAAEIRGRG